MNDIIEDQIILDRFALLKLMKNGALYSRDGRAIRASDEYLVHSSEYGELYRSAILARMSTNHRCEGRIHNVSNVLRKACVCADGWIPALSPSFLREILPVPIGVLPTPPEALGLRIRLGSSINGIGDVEAALIASLAWYPRTFVGCESDLSVAARGLIADVGITSIHVQHDCPYN